MWAVGAGGSFTLVVSAIRVWLSVRSSDVTIKLTKPDGTVIELNATKLPDAEKIAKLIAESMGERDVDSEPTTPEGR